MMLPTPGMTAWSMRTSHTIRQFWLLTASSAREELNRWEHTSRPSMALTFCTQSSINLQTYAPQGQLQHPWNDTSLNSFFHVVLQVCVFFFFLWDETAKVKSQTAEINVCLATEQYTTISQSMNRTNVRPKRRCFSCDNDRRLQTQP